MGQSRKFRHQVSSQRTIQTSLEKQLDPPSRGSVLVFLRKPIATCDFSVGSSHPIPPSGSLFSVEKTSLSNFGRGQYEGNFVKVFRNWQKL